MATQGRKPIPKTQREISVGLQTPTDATMGNPNYSNESSQNNRALQASFEGDTTKQFSVGIQDIDEAILFYFQNVIKPFCNTEWRKITCTYIIWFSRKMEINAKRWVL